MARPRIHSEERIVSAVRLPVPLRDELHRVAASRDVSVNYLINRAVENLLKQLAEQADPLLIESPPLETTLSEPAPAEPALDLTGGANS